jgi:hypothetical protein
MDLWILLTSSWDSIKPILDDQQLHTYKHIYN